jgi:poly-gamma-glutamate capsule biosynthesis protein CapA/YwtB (metallophosphatase superfamily)
MAQRLLFALPAAAAVAATLALAAVWAGGEPEDAAAQTPPAVKIVSKLPPWAAPGARLFVRGWTAPGANVRVIIGSRVRGRTVSGPRGGFRLLVRVPLVRGRYPVAVAVGETRVPAGRLRVRPLVLAAAGDVNLGDRTADAIRRYGARYPWLSVAPVLRRADLAVVNLECAVSTRGTPAPGKEFTFRGTPAALRAAGHYAGVDALSLANNHSLDYGRTAFLDTIANTRRAGIAPFGGGRDIRAARRPAVLTRGNLRVAFVGFSDIRPLGFDAGPGLPGATPAFPDEIRAGVRAARRRADVVVAYFHWGVERATVPNSRQRAFARIAFESGARVVLGAHPHVLQPRGRRGRRAVAWSLGNFVFPAYSPGTERTGILRLELAADGVRSLGFRRARIRGVQPRLVG